MTRPSKEESPFISKIGGNMSNLPEFHNVIDVKLRTSIGESFERLLKALAELYEGSICCSDNLHPEIDLPDSSKLYAPDSSQSKSVRSKIVDMDLDGMMMEMMLREVYLLLLQTES
ncbi:hypothetical protein POM88_006963 [Heracleum sosnowskyi]|uniref:Uncharacterized protein n=1 Tax=Heracleum sosnowskyi TaxID=360622 RepID=A0AAD8J3J8_9APIA|nr:hypothetical protein POM88_006963 [Heracleum sosnowskyi]